MSAASSSQVDILLLAGHSLAHLILISVAAVAGLALIWWDSRAWVMRRADRVGVIAAVFAGGLLGASLPDRLAGGVLQLRAQACAISPKTVIGGLLFGFAGAVLYKFIRGLKSPTSDAFARGTCLMMAIGRIGCYVQHCCIGKSTTWFWGQDLGDGIRRIPTQLIESALLWMALAGLHYLYRRNLFPDRKLFLFFTFYGVLRFIEEFWREPLATNIGPLAYYQWLSLVLALTGLYQVLKRTRVFVPRGAV